MCDEETMMSRVYHQVPCIFMTFLFQNINCFISNAAIGVLSESNLYLAKIKELNYTNDDFYLIYHHKDSPYHLQSFTSNNFIQRSYICSPSTVYELDLQPGSVIKPFVPVDDTPCLSSLTYLPKENLIWASFHSIVRLDVQKIFKDIIWNSSLTIIDMIYNDTNDNGKNDFYLSVKVTDDKSAVLHCRTHRDFGTHLFQPCVFIDDDYQQASALAVDHSRLYVADQFYHRIYALNLLPNDLVLTKDILPINTSTVADIRSMFIHDNNLIWLTSSGHVRIVSLITYEVRTIFWFEEQLRTIRLVSYIDWPSRTTSKTSTTRTITTSKSASEPMDTTTIHDNNNSTWKATAYITSIILGVALFLCAAMITCILLNYRIGRIVPHSFTNIFHILRNRTVTTPTTPISDDSLA